MVGPLLPPTKHGGAQVLRHCCDGATERWRPVCSNWGIQKSERPGSEPSQEVAQRAQSAEPTQMRGERQRRQPEVRHKQPKALRTHSAHSTTRWRHRTNRSCRACFTFTVMLLISTAFGMNPSCVARYSLLVISVSSTFPKPQLYSLDFNECSYHLQDPARCWSCSNKVLL